MALDPIDIERRLGKIEADVAVIRTEITNHVSELRADIHELREDTREVRNKIERLFGTVMSRQGPAPNGSKAWLVTVAGWAFGLLTLILSFLLGKVP